MAALYENIKQLCRQKHMTVFDLEKAAGLPFNTITRWGKTAPAFDKVAKVADVLEVTLDELVKGIE